MVFYYWLTLAWRSGHHTHEKQQAVISMDDVIVSQSSCRKTMRFNGWFFFRSGSFGLPVESLYLDWTSYDPVSLLTFPGRIWNNLSIYTNWGLLPTFITGKFAVFLWLVFFLFEAIFTYKFLFLKFELHRFFHTNRQICSSLQCSPILFLSTLFR